MRREMREYFQGEKAEGVPFVGAGLASFAVGGVLFSRRTAMARGAAWPVVLIGVIETVAGIVVYSRTDAQVARLDAQLSNDAPGFKRAETTRMERVNTEFDILSWAELGLVVGGLGMTTYGVLAEQDTLTGIGVGIAAQAAVMLMLDLFARERASRYTDALDRFRVGWTSTSPKDAGIFSLETRL